MVDCNEPMYVTIQRKKMPCNFVNILFEQVISDFGLLSRKRVGLFLRITLSLIFLVLLPLSGREASASLPRKPQKRILLLYSLDRMIPPTK